MIIVRLKEGLGNQMFQYACGKSLARRFKTRLVLDTRFYAKVHPFLPPRKFSLDKFHVREMLLEDMTDDLLPDELLHLEEGDDGWLQYHSDLMKAAGKNSYLDGYWQSWRYFDDIGPLIRKKFRIRKEYISLPNRALGESMRRENSVSVHVRRTDFLIPQLSHIGVLPLDYYHRAIPYVMEQVPLAKFYLFSDDPDWAEENITIPSKAHIIRGNTDIEDLYLMSQCRHNIIANSTFSWWGAWLNTYSDKIVIAPQKWFLGSNINTDDTDLIPPGWITIDF